MIVISGDSVGSVRSRLSDPCLGGGGIEWAKVGVFLGGERMYFVGPERGELGGKGGEKEKPPSP